MAGIFETLSLCLYGAGVLLLTGSAAVFKRNGLYEYYCLIHGRLVKKEETGESTGVSHHRRRRQKTFGGSQDNAGKTSLPEGKRRPPREKPERGTQVLDGRNDTVLLERENGAAGENSEKTEENHVWAGPSGRFRVIKSEVVVHTDKIIGARTATKGETDET